MCTAGRDEGGFQFESETLAEHLRFYVRLLRGLGDTRVNPRTLRIDVTPIGPGREDMLARTVIEPLAAEFPVATVVLDHERDRALEYYRDVCVQISIDTPAGEHLELVDGGFTDWTQQLLGNRKERLLTTGIGLELLSGALSP